MRKILEYAEGTKYEMPIILACYGLRRSEICALTLEDINGDTVSVTKALVQNENREWIVKTTKTTASIRSRHHADGRVGDGSCNEVSLSPFHDRQGGTNQEGSCREATECLFLGQLWTKSGQKIL